MTAWFPPVLLYHGESKSNEKAMGAVLFKEAAYDFAPERVGDVKHSLGDISLARELIDYEAVVSFEIGLRKTFEYLRS